MDGWNIMKDQLTINGAPCLHFCHHSSFSLAILQLLFHLLQLYKTPAQFNYLIIEYSGYSFQNQITHTEYYKQCMF